VILNKWTGKAWNGLTRLSIGTVGEILWMVVDIQRQ
jgi:hypothetical protein